MSFVRRLVRGVAAKIPKSIQLASHEWELRHLWIVRLLWAHAVGIVVFAAARHTPGLHTLTEATPVAALAFLAGLAWLNRSVRAICAGLGLMTAAAVFVHLSGGLIEMHFLFFILLGVISLYQDWRPFLLAIGFVAAHHATMGTLQPEAVFANDEAWRAPVLWAGIHAMFVLFACAVNVVSWRIIEDGHRKSRASLERSERRFRALIENSDDVVTVVDAAGVILYDSPSSARVLGYEVAERVGVDGLSFIHPDDVARTSDMLAGVVARAGTVARIELRVRHRDGAYRWVEASVSNLLDEPGVRGIVANFRDVTERRALEDQLAHQAFHDPLTGLANRALLIDRVDHARATAARRPGVRLALIYVDLDDFKTVNDALGHEAGDRLLEASALRIVSVLRPGDTAARLGGDEFAVLLEDLANPNAAYEVGARLLEALREPFEVDGTVVHVNASLGIAVSAGSDDAAALLRNADLAMYRAKGGGKGRFEVYEAGMHAAVVERMGLKADLRRAVEAMEFEPYYQPIVDLASGRATGAEALVRWRHPERGLMAPITFIPLAEETGLIIDIGRHVLERACRDAAGWRASFGAAAPASVSVNLSARQIQHPDVVADVARALRLAGLPPHALTLEITESILLEDTEAAARTLASLKQLGVKIALDDFGTGYSSLSYLDRFPVDIVKIDKSFIDALAGDGPGSPLVTAIVNLGSLLGLGVTAEGIEVPEQVEQLRALGCLQGQGYYFAKPISASDFQGRLEKTLGTLAKETLSRA